MLMIIGVSRATNETGGGTKKCRWSFYSAEHFEWSQWDSSWIISMLIVNVGIWNFIFKLSNFETFKLWNVGTLKLWNFETFIWIIYSIIDSSWLLVHGSWRKDHGSCLKACGSRLLAHRQEKLGTRGLAWGTPLALSREPWGMSNEPWASHEPWTTNH